MHLPASMRVAAACVILMVPVAGSAAAGPVALDDTRVGWSSIRMTATKLFMTASSTLGVRILPAEGIAGDLRVPAAGKAVMPGNEVAELVYSTAGLGRQSTMTLLMDPVSGAALQNTVHDSAGRLRLRTYRYADTGAYQWTRWPASGEEKLPPAKWSTTSEGMRDYVPAADSRTVLESGGLLYAIAAAPLARPGDRVEFAVFQRKRLHRVLAEVRTPRSIQVRYQEQWPTGNVERSGKVMPLLIVVRGVAEPGGDDEELELLGLSGELALSLDPETRTPLQLAGRVKILGGVTLRLASVRLR
jgi:hypothetical protein